MEELTDAQLTIVNDHTDFFHDKDGFDEYILKLRYN